MASHPLDRNRFQIQDLERMDERKGGIRRIEREVKVAGPKDLQPLKVWKDIYRAVHPFGQNNLKSREGVGDVPTRRLHKVEYGNRIAKVHYSEIGRCTFADCSHEWLNELVKTSVQVDEFKVHQRLQDLEVVVFSMRWR